MSSNYEQIEWVVQNGPITKNGLLPVTTCFLENFVSTIPDRYGSVPIFLLDRPSVSIGTDFFRQDFCNGEGLERSGSENDTRSTG